ncbi:MAG: hypothetical protein ACLSE6_04070 [Alphaproteobacteria bacterium]
MSGLPEIEYEESTIGGYVFPFGRVSLGVGWKKLCKRQSYGVDNITSRQKHEEDKED